MQDVDEIVKKCIDNVSESIKNAFDEEIAIALLDRNCPMCKKKCSYQYDELLTDTIKCQFCDHKFDVISCKAFECQLRFIPYSQSGLCPYHIRKNGIAFSITKVLDVLGKIIVPELLESHIRSYIDIRMKQHSDALRSYGTNITSNVSNGNDSDTESHMSFQSDKSHKPKKTTSAQTTNGNIISITDSKQNYVQYLCKSLIPAKNKSCDRPCTVEVVMSDGTTIYVCGLHGKKYKK